MRKILTLLTVLLLGIFTARAQSRTITGKVADNAGKPVEGASVTIKGTTRGTTTIADGTFAIIANTGDVFVITALNFGNVELTVGSSNSVSATLTGITSNLSEVVVTTALGIQRQARELGYSTVKVNNSQLTQAKVTNISTGLAGKVSGLQVNLVNNGINPNTRVVLRGNRSLTGNNQALLVVDGVPIDDINYINKIDPEDVENVSVLKGAVAAAIYGSKASNGVLIISTKRGTKGKPTFTVSNTTNIENLSYLPKLQNTFGVYGGEGGAYTNANGTVNYVPYENQSYGPAFNGGTVPLAISPIFGPDGTTVTGYDTLYTKYSAIPNAKRNFWQTGLTNQFNASYSVGDDKSTFYLGLQDIEIKGITPNDLGKRQNLRLNGTRDFGRLHTDYSLSYNQNKANVAGLSYNQTAGGVFSGRPVYFEVMNLPASFNVEDFKDWKSNVYASPDGFPSAYSTNPYWTLDNSRRKNTTYDLIGNVGLSFRITDWLNLSDRVGLTQTTQLFKYTRAGISFAPWAIADPWGAGNVPSSQTYLAPSNYDESFLEQRLNNDLVLSFNKDLGNFSLKGLVGNNLAQRYRRDIYLQGDNLQFNGFYNISSVLGTPGYGETSYRQREASIYEEVTIGFKDFLFLHGTNRDEWNSVLDASQRHFEYPGGDLSFIFTQGINALKGNKFLNYGKIRGGISRVANINLGTTPYGAYSLENYFLPSGGFPYGTLGGYGQSTVSLNPLIKPEITTGSEVGIELGFLQNRINLTANYFNSISKDQSLVASVSAATGYTQKVVNAGKVSNQGIELDITVTPIRSKNVTWTVGANYAHYKNRVKELLPGVNELLLGGFNDGVSGGIYAIVGQAYPVIKTTDWVRDSATGKVIVDPVTGRPSVDATSKSYGNTNPTDILGLTTTLSFKGFTFGAVVDYRGGNYIMNALGANLDFTGIGYHSSENGRQRFIFPNSVVADGTGKYVENTSVAVNNGGNTGGAGFWPDVYTSGIGSVYVTSADFWKLREVSLTYDIPASVLARAGFIKRATIGVVGRNLIMLRPKENFYTDPEFAEDNSNAVGRTSDYQQPPTRLYGATLTLTF